MTSDATAPLDGSANRARARVQVAEPLPRRPPLVLLPARALRFVTLRLLYALAFPRRATPWQPTVQLESLAIPFWLGLLLFLGASQLVYFLHFQTWLAGGAIVVGWLTVCVLWERWEDRRGHSGLWLESRLVQTGERRWRLARGRRRDPGAAGTPIEPREDGLAPSTDKSLLLRYTRTGRREAHFHTGAVRQIRLEPRPPEARVIGRGAVRWALGLILEDEPDAPLVLGEFLTTESLMGPLLGLLECFPDARLVIPGTEAYSLDPMSPYYLDQFTPRAPAVATSRSQATITVAPARAPDQLLVTTFGLHGMGLVAFAFERLMAATGSGFTLFAEAARAPDIREGLYLLSQLPVSVADHAFAREFGWVDLGVLAGLVALFVRRLVTNAQVLRLGILGEHLAIRSRRQAVMLKLERLTLMAWTATRRPLLLLADDRRLSCLELGLSDAAHMDLLNALRQLVRDAGQDPADIQRRLPLRHRAR